MYTMYTVKGEGVVAEWSLPTEMGGGDIGDTPGCITFFVVITRKFTWAANGQEGCGGGGGDGRKPREWASFFCSC